MSELSRYLFRGQLHHPSCLRLSRNCRPALSPASSTRPFSLSSTRLQEGTLSNAPPQETSPSYVPLRKQLKAEEKALKASGRAKTDNASRQVVPGWELTVGIEIHAQLNTRHKLFSPASPPLPTEDPNSRVALFDLATPGSQPIFQTDALIPAIRAALALNCDVQRVSRWDRKHYFWWDQPSGYQITQYYEPFAREGHIKLYKRDGIAEEDGDEVTVGITQVQMEQDTAKTLARPGGVQWVDFNRVGVPLIEIITKPEIHHPKTAAALVRKIQTYLSAVDACVSGMEAGGLRADVNVSVRSTDPASFETMPLGQRTEIKNLSSFKAVEDAIIAERDRQIAVLTQGGVIAGETRGWSIGGTETMRLRGKEGEVDYRYMPDPDLGPIIIGDDIISHLSDSLGALPDAELDELVGDFGLRTKDAMSLMQLDGGGRLEYFYDVISHLRYRLGDHQTKDSSVMAANWVLHELGRLTSERNASADGIVEDLGMTPSGECTRVPARHLADIIYFLHAERISSSVAKELLFAVFRGDLSGGSPEGYSSVQEAIEKEGLWFQKMSEERYVTLATELLQSENLSSKFLKHFSQGTPYPEGQLMYLVGKMMRSGPRKQMDARVCQATLRRLIEKVFKEPPK